MIPRWLHRVYADALGYFWIPCPVCGRMFGGHEHGDAAVWNDRTMREGRCVCSRHGDSIRWPEVVA